MKQYTVPRSTTGKLIIQDENVDVQVQDWVTRKTLKFYDTILDPVRLANIRDTAKECLATSLARDGYALFGGEGGSDGTAQYILAVPYNKVQVQ